MEARGIQSIGVGGQLLNALIQRSGPMTLGEISSATGLTPAQAHAYLVSFKRTGLVEQELDSGPYQIGPFALSLGICRLRTVPLFRNLANLAVELAEEMNLMMIAVVWGPRGPTAVEVVPARDNRTNLNIRVGTQFAVTGTSGGRVFGAFSQDEQVAEQIEREFSGATQQGVTSQSASPVDFRKECEEIRQRGYSVVVDAGVPGFTAIAVPVFDADNTLAAVLTCVGGEPLLAASAKQQVAATMIQRVKAL